MPNKLSYYFKKEKITVIFSIIFGILFNVFEVFDAIILGKVIDSVNENRSLDAIIKACIFYFSIILLINILRFFKRFFIRMLSNKIERRMRNVMYDYLITVPIKDFEKENMGNLMSRIIGDITITANGIRKAVTEVFDTGIRYIAFIIMMMLYDPILTLYVLAFVPLIILAALFLRKRIQNASYKAREYNSYINGKTYNLIDNTLLLRRYGSLESEIDSYYKNLDELKKKEFIANLFEGSLEPIYTILIYGGLGLIMFLAAMNVINEKNTVLYGIWTIGAFTTYLKLSIEIFRKTTRVSILINMVEKAKISFLRIKPYLVIIEDNSTNRDFIKGDLKVTNLCLYKGNEILLDNISFDAKLGDIIGVTGKIASGKSLLGLSLSAIYSYDGSIKLNDVELKEMSNKERAKLISYMPHKSYLMSDTIKNNILFGDTSNIDDLFDITALKYDILEMDEKENTLIGNNGVRLSGGQGQRVSLSRALYNNKNLIILDDPFSAVDMKTEVEIIEKIKANYKDSIIVLISHRLQIFPYVTNVLMLDNNKYYFAPHEKLMSLSKNYHDIYLAQRGDMND